MIAKRIASDVLLVDCGCWMDSHECIHWCVKHRQMLNELSEIPPKFDSGYRGSNEYRLIVETIPPKEQRGDAFG